MKGGEEIMTMLKSLEVLALGKKDEKHYPISPKLKDRTRLTTWRQNLLTTATVPDRQRYARAIRSIHVREKLELTDNHGS